MGENESNKICTFTALAQSSTQERSSSSQSPLIYPIELEDVELNFLTKGHKFAILPSNCNNYVQKVLDSDIATALRMVRARNVPMQKESLLKLSLPDRKLEPPLHPSDITLEKFRRNLAH